VAALRKCVAETNNVLPDEVKLLSAETEEELPDAAWISDLLGSSEELDVQVVIATPDEDALRLRLSRRCGASCFEDMTNKTTLEIPYFKPDHMRDYCAVGANPELASQMDHLPDGIGDLHELKKLNMGGHQLRHLPQAIGDLSHLRELKLYRNKLQSLPESIGRLGELEVLNLEENQFETFPESFGQLTRLSQLDLTTNRVHTLPDSIGCLVALSELKLSENRLESLPESFGALVNLKRLVLEKNRLTALPESFANLASLEDFSCRKNFFESLPDTIARLGALECLDLVGNPLQSLPDNFGECPKLRTLYLLQTPIQELPESFKKLLTLQDFRFNMSSVQTQWRSDFVRLLPKELQDGREFRPYKENTGCCPFRFGAKKFEQDLQHRKDERHSIRSSRVSTSSVMTTSTTTSGAEVLQNAINEQRQAILQETAGTAAKDGPAAIGSSGITFSSSVKATASEKEAAALEQAIGQTCI